MAVFNSDNVGSIPALMVAPPNAQLIADGYKDVENRTQNCKMRGYVALYASRSKLKWRFDYWNEKGFNYSPDDVDYGVILGFVKIVEVIEPGKRKGYRGDWYQKGSHGIWVKNVVKLKRPVRVSFPNGVITWGKLKGKPLQACLKQLSVKQRKAVLQGLAEV